MKSPSVYIMREHLCLYTEVPLRMKVFYEAIGLISQLKVFFKVNFCMNYIYVFHVHVEQLKIES